MLFFCFKTLIKKSSHIVVIIDRHMEEVGQILIVLVEVMLVDVKVIVIMSATTRGSGGSGPPKS